MMRSAALLCFGLAACSGSGPADPPFAGSGAESAISLRNDTAAPIVFIAAGEGTLALLFIPPRLPAEEFGDRLVPPGRAVPVEDIIGYLPDLGVNFYIYRVDRGRGDAAFAGTFLATAAELARTGGVVSVTPSRF